MERQKRFERRVGKPDGHPDDGNPHTFQVLNWLLRLRFLTSEQVGELLDPPRRRSAVFDLLRRLYDARLITRFDVPVRKKWGMAQTYGAVQAIHCLDRAGADYLADRFELTRHEVDWQPRDNQKQGFLAHTLATNDALIAFHLGAKALGWQFDLVQNEREIHRRGGNDWIRDPQTGENKPVKPDAVACLTLHPDQTRVWMSLELDMGTEGEKRIKQKLRLHRAYYQSGAYEARFGTKSNRILFVVADVRDPLLMHPVGEAEWQRRVAERVQSMKCWAEEEGLHGQFWFAASTDLTAEAVWRKPVWWKAGERHLQSFVT